MSVYQDMVHEFNVAVGTKRDPLLRIKLIEEEARETLKAIEAEDPIETIDGLCDLLYVTYGAADVYGLRLDTEADENDAVRNPPMGFEEIKKHLGELDMHVRMTVMYIGYEELPSMKIWLEHLACGCWLVGSQGLGIDLRPFFEEVHRTNMLKLGGPRRSDGKILKPAGWQPPRIADMYAKRRGMPVPEGTP